MSSRVVPQIPLGSSRGDYKIRIVGGYLLNPLSLQKAHRGPNQASRLINISHCGSFPLHTACLNSFRRKLLRSFPPPCSSSPIKRSKDQHDHSLSLIGRAGDAPDFIPGHDDPPRPSLPPHSVQPHHDPPIPLWGVLPLLRRARSTTRGASLLADISSSGGSYTVRWEMGQRETGEWRWRKRGRDRAGV